MQSTKNGLGGVFRCSPGYNKVGLQTKDYVVMDDFGRAA